MEFKELVKLRRSVRDYQECEITKQDIEEMIACALMAPSWKNSQTGRYYFALSKQAKEEVYDCLPQFNQNSCKKASGYIISCYQSGISGYSGENVTEAGDKWGAYDLGLQNSYLLLKASELGYDTLIMGLRDEKRLREYFEIPEDYIVLPVIAVGKRNGEPVFRPRKAVAEVLQIK